MGLSDIFKSGVNTIFGVFSEAVKEATYQVIEVTGFEDAGASPIQSSTEIRLIADSFSQEDVNSLSFAKEIQPTDIKGLVPGEDLAGITPKTTDRIVIDSTGEVFTVVAHDVDPLRAMFTMLLRNA